MPQSSSTVDIFTVTPALRKRLSDAVTAVPADKKFLFEGFATNLGVEASVGWKATERWDVAAFVGREWSGGNLQYGVRARYMF